MIFLAGNIIFRLDKANAGLQEIYRLYLFARGIPFILSPLYDLKSYAALNHSAHADAFSNLINSEFISPLESINSRLGMYCQLVEHVVDFDRLPDLYVSPRHDEELGQLQEQLDSLHDQVF